MQIDHEIVSLPPQPPREPEIRHNPRESGRLRRDNHLIEMRVAGNDWRRRRFDQIREVRLRKRPPQRAQHRRGEDDVADEAEANE